MISIPRTATRIRCWTHAIAARFQNRQVVHFLHIGKTGGTAIKHAIRNDLKTDQYLILAHNHDFRLSMVGPREKAVFFLRDPIARFVSGFNSRKRKGQPRYYFEWSKEEATAFAEFDMPDDLASALDDRDSKKRARAVAAMRNIRHVGDTYETLFGGLQGMLEGGDKVACVGFHEQMARSFDDFKAVLGLPERVVLPQDDVVAHRSPQMRGQTLSNIAKENLETWYAEDYRIYNHLKTTWWPSAILAD